MGQDGLVFISLPSPISSQVGGTPVDRGIDFPLPLFYTEKLILISVCRIGIFGRGKIVFEKVKWWTPMTKNMNLYNFLYEVGLLWQEIWLIPLKSLNAVPLPFCPNYYFALLLRFVTCSLQHCVCLFHQSTHPSSPIKAWEKVIRGKIFCCLLLFCFVFSQSFKLNPLWLVLIIFGS